MREREKGPTGIFETITPRQMLVSGAARSAVYVVPPDDRRRRSRAARRCDTVRSFFCFVVVYLFGDGTVIDLVP